MVVPEHADWEANHMSSSWPQRYYFYRHPWKSYNISVFFANDIVPPREKVDDPIPSNKECNANDPKSFRVVDHKDDCLKLWHSVQACKFSSISIRVLPDAWLTYLLGHPAVWGMQTNLGSSVIQHRADHGCAVWTITAYHGQPECWWKGNCQIVELNDTMVQMLNGAD